jgi:hypothetical protein
MGIVHNYTIVCDTAIPSQDGRLSLINIFENVRVAKLPAILPRLTVVSNLSGAGGQDITVQVVAPNGRDVLVRADERFKPDPPAEQPYQVFSGNLLLETSPVPLSEAGVYHVEVRQGNDVISAKPFSVIVFEEFGGSCEDGNDK